MVKDKTDTCFCGIAKPYEVCCGKFHNHTSIAETAEELMRSRYSAFCTNNINYLIETHHPSKRTLDQEEELKQSLNITWLKLDILSKEKGMKIDNKGTVEFAAYYSSEKNYYKLQEKSYFIKENGRWYYLDGKLSPNTTISKSDSCWCGSGKKFKRCHGK